MDLPRTNSQSPAGFLLGQDASFAQAGKGHLSGGILGRFRQTTQRWSGETAIIHSSVRREEHRMELHWGLCGTNHCLRC